MRISVISLIIASVFTVVVSRSCKNMRIRRNIRSLSSSEWSNLVNAFYEVIIRGTVEEFAEIHVKSFPYIHDNPQFLPWHRYFLFEFENQVRKISPKLTIPYWDSAADFEAPHLSKILSPGYFGGNGDPKFDNCVRDGFQSNFYVLYPSAHCLRRNYTGSPPGTIEPWHTSAFITSLMQTTSIYDNFYQLMEESLHNTVHTSIGGFGGDFTLQHSVVDFLFWIHHSNTDRIWAKWQASDPSHLESMNGLQLFPDGTIQEITADHKLEHYGIPVKAILKTTEEPLCYSYDDIAAPNEMVPKLAIQKLQLLPEALLKKYFPKIFDGSATTLDIDFGDLATLEANLGKPLPIPKPMPKEFFEMMNFNSTRGQDTQKLSEDFVIDINLGLFGKSQRTSDENRSRRNLGRLHSAKRRIIILP